MTTHDARLRDTGTELVRPLNRSTSTPDINGQTETKESVVAVGGYDALEIDFRGHHQTNAARRRGPYEHYRLVYRYGYDLGSDPRYRCAEWSHVEWEARPRWEERNPGTWEQFKDIIRYAWEKAREQC
jgi:hypothetical protein